MGASDEDTETIRLAINAAAANLLRWSRRADDHYCVFGPTYSAIRCSASINTGILAAMLQRIDKRFCGLYAIEGFRADLGHIAQCPSGDGVVPEVNQLWGSAGYAVDYAVPGPSHVEQTRSPGVRTALEQFLTVRAGVARCGAGPATHMIADGRPIVGVGGSVRWTVSGQDACDVLTSAPLGPLSATSSNLGVATVRVEGRDVLVEGHADGQASITMSNGTVSLTREVRVPPPTYLELRPAVGPSGPYLPGDAIEISLEVISGSILPNRLLKNERIRGNLLFAGVVEPFVDPRSSLLGDSRGKILLADQLSIYAATFSAAC